MSSILKALKKVEEEKAAQRNAAPLASDLAKNRRRQPSASRWEVPAVVVAVTVVAVVITIAAMGGFYKEDQAAISPPVEPKPAATENVQPAPVADQIPTIQVASVQVTSDSVSAKALPAVLKKESAPKEKQQPVAPHVPVVAVRPIVAVKPSVVVKPAVAAKPVVAAKQIVAATAAPTTVTRREPTPFLRTTLGSFSPDQAHPEFKINGIAWQMESSSRLAVVNGVAVTQGATVDGAKVVEILPDRVRLSQGGRTFEILLGRINNYR